MESMEMKEDMVLLAANKIKTESLEIKTEVKEEFLNETTNDMNNYVVYEIQELQQTDDVMETFIANDDFEVMGKFEEDQNSSSRKICSSEQINEYETLTLTNLYSMNEVGNIKTENTLGNSEIKIPNPDEGDLSTAFMARTNATAVECKPNVSKFKKLALKKKYVNSERSSKSTKCRRAKRKTNSQNEEIIVAWKGSKFSYEPYYEVRDNHIICLKCPNSEKYKYKEAIFRHIRIEHYGVKFICPECQHEFLDRYRLKKHLKIKHNLNMNRLDESSFTKLGNNACTINEENFIMAAGANASEESHVMETSSKNDAVVANVENSFSYKQYYRVQGNNIICLKCDNSKEFIDKQSIIRHISMDHLGLKYTCPNCLKIYMHKHALNRHLRNVCPVKKAMDLDAGMPENSECTDQSHVNMEEDPADENDNGDESDKIKKIRFNYTFILKKVDNGYICHKCANFPKFECRMSAENHVRHKHFGVQFVCPECQKEYKAKNSLSYHLRHIHKIGIKSIAIEKIFKYKYNSADLVVIANNEGDILCKTSTVRDSPIDNLQHVETLESDVESLQDDEDFRLQASSANFSKEPITDLRSPKEQAKIDKHYERISKKQLILYNKLIKKSSCIKCKNKFRGRSAALYHIRTKHMRIQYICPKCQQEFNTQMGFSRHMRFQHQLYFKTLKNFIKITKKLSDILSDSTSSTDNDDDDGDDDDAGETTILNVDIKDKKYMAVLLSQKQQAKIDKHYARIQKEQKILYNKLIKKKTCLKCKNKYPRKSAALYHIRTKHMRIQYVCPKCQREINTQMGFSVHMRVQHQLNFKTFKNFIKIPKKLPNILSGRTNRTVENCVKLQTPETTGKTDDGAGETMIMDIVIKDEKLL